MRDSKIQWHPGFVAAMNLELMDYRDGLVFEKEYNLNTKPLEIDLLIIKKEASLHISNDIAFFFRGHNILEYKSPEDHLDIDTFSKTLAYAYLYKSYGKTLDEIKTDDITISIVREAKPAGLFRYFREHGCSVSTRYSGIYYIEGPFPFPIQIITTRQLDKKSHTWLNALSSKLDKRDIRNLLDLICMMTEKTDREMAGSVLEVSIGANRHIVEELMGDDLMFETLMEIMEPRINEIRKNDREAALLEGRQAGQKEGIQGAIEMLRNLQFNDDEIKSEIMRQYGLTEDEAASFFLVV